jgi:hypothetical protein
VISHKAKAEAYMDLVAQMQKLIAGGDGDKKMGVSEAVEEAQEEMGERPKIKEIEALEGEPAEGMSLEEYIKSEMKKGGKIPVKGKAAMMFAAKETKPMSKKMKYG